jgi:hypothetical protein
MPRIEIELYDESLVAEYQWPGHERLMGVIPQQMRRFDDTEKTTASANENGQVIGAALRTMVEVGRVDEEDWKEEAQTEKLCIF